MIPLAVPESLECRVTRLALRAAVSTGFSACWAGSFPLPDPRHNPGVLGAGTFLCPLLLLPAFRSVPNARGLKTYLAINLAALAALAPVMAGVTGIDPQRFGGLVQRLGALTAFVPPAVTGWFLLRRTNRRTAGSGAGT